MSIIRRSFFLKALDSCTNVGSQAGTNKEKETQFFPNSGRPVPRVINVDKNAAYPKAIADLKAAGVLPTSVELRQVKYLNNLIEQDHRAHQTIGQARDGLLFR